MKPRNMIGRKVKLIRKKKGITQEDLAARLNIQGIDVDQPMIARIENQERVVLDYEIFGLAKALGVTIEELFKDK